MSMSIQAAQIGLGELLKTKKIIIIGCKIVVYRKVEMALVGIRKSILAVNAKII